MNADETIPKRLRANAERHPDLPFYFDKDENGEFKPCSHRHFFEHVSKFACGLMEIGINRGDHVGIISENRKEWLTTDIALLGIGAIDVPRGADSTSREIKYILKHADCPMTLVEDQTQLNKVIEVFNDLPELKTIIVMDGSFKKAGKNTYPCDVYTYSEVVDVGEKRYNKNPDTYFNEMEKGVCDDIATIIYTSGTTGDPKGVMLSHRTFLFQMDRTDGYINIGPQDILLSVLPVWHSFERAVEYIFLGKGTPLAYSKAVGKIMLADMAKIKPTWMPSVPRIWEGVRSAVYRNVKQQSKLKQALFHFFVSVGSIHSFFLTMFRGLCPQFTKRYRALDITVSILPLILLTPFQLLGNLLVFRSLKQKLGGRFVAGISGGGALPTYVDQFFRAAGILLLEGYGLTETGPILTVRKQHSPVPGTVGELLPDIESRVLGPDQEILPPGQKGVLHVKSIQIMDGYYKQPEKTREVLKNGWLNTGDIAVYTHNNEFKILGREKETIVLRGGENIEPVPIEDKMSESEAINQVMVIGQDQKFLAALIVPEIDKLTEIANKKSIQYIEAEELIEVPEIQEYVHDEIQSLINPGNGFKAFERIYRFKLLAKPFEVGEELTHSLKKRRNIIEKKYQGEIKRLFK